MTFDHRGSVSVNNLLFRTDFSLLINVFFRLFSSLGWWIIVFVVQCLFALVGKGLIHVAMAVVL